MGGESQGNPTRGGECHLFLAEKLPGAFGQPAFILAANRMIIVACESGFFKSLSLFSKTTVQQCRSFKLEKKIMYYLQIERKTV